MEGGTPVGSAATPFKRCLRSLSACGAGKIAPLIPDLLDDLYNYIGPSQGHKVHALNHRRYFSDQTRRNFGRLLPDVFFGNAGHLFDDCVGDRDSGHIGIHKLGHAGRLYNHDAVLDRHAEPLGFAHEGFKPFGIVDCLGLKKLGPGLYF
jgi:hypothetical protein